MKKILFIFAFAAAFVPASAQYPITQNLGSDNTLIRVGPNSLGGIKGGLINMTFTDTTAANATNIDYYAGSQIFTTNDTSFWIRNKTATSAYWFKVGGAGGGTTGSFWNLTGNYLITTPAGYGLGTNSPDNLPIKTDNTTRIILPSTGFALSNDTTSNKVLTWNPTSKLWGYANWVGGGGGTTYTFTNGLTESGGTVKLGGSLVDANTTIATGGNALNITGLVSGSSTDSVLTWNASTGQVKKRNMASITGVNIYNSDGTLTGDRELNGGALYSLTIDDVLGFNVSSRNRSAVELNAYDGSKISQITVHSDSILIAPNSTDQKLYFRNIPSGSSTDSVLVWTAGTGQVKKRDVSALVSTPTLQQVLTAGNTATSNAKIALGTNSFYSSGTMLQLFRTDDANITFDTDDDFAQSVLFQKNGAVSAELTFDHSTNLLSLTATTGHNVQIINNGEINMKFYNDSTSLLPPLGALNIDSLRTWSTIADTTYKKPMTWDTRNGRWEYASNWFGGGGGGGVPGGTNRSLQINNGGSFGGSDSLTKSGGVLYYKGATIAAYNVATSYRTQGSIHLEPTHTNGYGQFITFGSAYASTADSAMAAIGVYSSDAYGSKMVLGTTNNFSGGWTAAMQIDQNRYVNIAQRLLVGSITTVPSNEFEIYGRSVLTSSLNSYVPLIINGTASQSANLTEWKNSGGTLLASVTPTGGSTWSGRVQQAQGADVASANNLTLGSDGNTFEITGTTQINLIANTTWQNGSVIHLIFTSNPTVKNGQTTSGSNITIMLAGAADFVASADDVLTLMLCEIGGTQAWREVSRSVN